jgi:hypothetical protein
MKSRLNSFAKGAAANGLRGLATSATSAILPLALVLVLPSSEFRIWAVAITIGNSALLLDLGLQQGIIAAMGGEAAGHDGAVELAAALRFVTPIVAVAAAGVSMVAGFSRRIFPWLPATLETEFQLTVGILFIAALATIVSNMMWGIALSKQMFHPCLGIIIGGRVLALVGAILTAIATKNATLAALSYLGPILLSLPFQANSLGLKRRSLFERSLEAVAIVHIFRRNARTFGAWSLSAFMISGLDGAIIGRFDYARVGAYLVAAALSGALVGSGNAWQPAFLALVSRLPEQHSSERVQRHCRIGVVVNLVVLCAALPISSILLHVVSSDTDGDFAYVVFATLMMSACLRQFAAPAILIAVASQRIDRLVRPVLLEAVLNVTLSVVLCQLVGAVGVAVGTLAGSIVSVVLMTRWIAADQRWIGAHGLGLARKVLLDPLAIVGIPIGGSFLSPLVLSSGPSLILQILLFPFVLLVATSVLLSDSERSAIRTIVGSPRRPPVSFPN